MDSMCRNVCSWGAATCSGPEGLLDHDGEMVLAGADDVLLLEADRDHLLLGHGGEDHDRMWPLLGTVVPFVVRLDQAAVGTSNPSYSGNVLINGWNPIEGSVGDEASVSLGFPTSGAVVRATS